MTDAGFFRGTSADQDNRFANKQKKLLKELNFSPILNTKLNMSKIDIDSLRPWIEEKIKEILEKDDDILSESIYEHLAEKEPDGKNILVIITGFVDEAKANKFMEELWNKLIDAQESSNGKITAATGDVTTEPNPKEGDPTSDGGEKAPEQQGSSNNNNNSSKGDSPRGRGHSSDSSHPPTPSSRSVSKSPGRQTLDERSRGRPRKRAQDEDSRKSRTPTPERKDSRSPAHSKSGSKSGSDAADKKKTSRSRSRSGSHSRSPRQHSSRSRSPSRRRSRSRSSSNRPLRRRPRSPYGGGLRGRRSRSHEYGGYRRRSPSPRARRGMGGRGMYRGGYDDRRRGGPIGRRPSPPWASRRRYSPRRSPPRHRRSPSPYSPRGRHSPSPYRRRSRSPIGHMAGRSMPMSRGRPGDMMSRRPPLPHHDVHRPMGSGPIRASPLEHRAYPPYMMSRRSRSPLSKQADLPPLSHGPGTVGAWPSAGYRPRSPRSRSKSRSRSRSVSSSSSSSSGSRRKHKKDRKHRKHKKSKKHRSPSSERKKKHKKHKKNKKHKSH